jgi:hypothetical protein
MADPDRTPPDLLGSLLSGKKQEPSGIPVDHKAGIPERQHTIKPVRQRKPAVKKPPTPPVEEPSDLKIKATFYISTGAVEALEAGWIQLRSLAPKKSRGQISKSLIVELSLQEALQELKSKKDKSILAKKTR